jgi:putative flippase GtrA
MNIQTNLKKHLPLALLFIKFLAAGLPAFGLGVLINYGLVDFIKLAIPIAYIIVLLFQVTCNFFMCRIFVFKNTDEKLFCIHKYKKFMSSILIFRLLDWLLYVFMTHYLGIYYLLAQVINVVVFSILKFTVTKYIFIADK